MAGLFPLRESMVEQITIRRAKNAEHEALISLMLRAMRHGGSKSYSPELLAAWLAPGNEVFEFYLARNLIVAERQGKILGFGGWRPEIKKKTRRGWPRSMWSRTRRARALAVKSWI